MYGSSNPFGQPSSRSLFGSQTPSMFGQTNNATSNPFGAQMGSPMFGQPQASSPFGVSSASGQTSFGFSTQPQSNPFGASTLFGPQIGSNMFGGTSTGVFGQPQASSPFGVSSAASGQTSFGFSSQPQSNPFGNNTQHSQAVNNGFGSSTPFGTTSAFGVLSTPSLGNNGFGSTSAFGVSSTPSFAVPSSPSFSFGSSAAFGHPTSAASAVSSSPSFSFGSSSAFGQPTSAFSSTQSPFAPASTPASKGSRVMPYTPASMDEMTNDKKSILSLLSISGMPVYIGKSHEELRLEDYEKGDKGGQHPMGQFPGGSGFSVMNSQPSSFLPSPMFSQTSANSANAFSSSTSTNPFAQKTPTPSSIFSSPFAQATATSPFGTSSSTTPNVFGPSNSFATAPSQSLFALSSNPGSTSSPSFTTNVFGPSTNFATAPSPSIFAPSSTPGFTSSPSSSSCFATAPSQSLFAPSSSSGFTTTPSTTANTSASSVPANASTPAFSFNNSQPSPLFSSNPSTGPPGQNTNFSSPSTGMANLYSSTSSLTTSSSPFQTNPASLLPNQSSQPGNSVVMQPMPFTNPFGTLPAVPQISIAQGGNSPSIQYGISSRPVVDRPSPVRTSPLLTMRHISQRRGRPLPLRKYRPGDDGPKVPFFSDEENWNTPKANALIIPREDRRALFIRPLEREKSAAPKDCHTPLQEKNDNGEIRDVPLVKANHTLKGTNENHRGQKEPSDADIKSLMPKLKHCEYFTEPRIQELAAKERVDPGYCKRVRDFVVGRHGYGNIKFLGETDVRKLDLDALVQFNNREVIVYMDESKKPLVGEELNKPAEVTLLNIKGIDKKTGKQVKEGSRVDKFREKLKTKTEEQGAEFVSYDAVNGEWKFRVQHF